MSRRRNKKNSWKVLSPDVNCSSAGANGHDFNSDGLSEIDNVQNRFDSLNLVDAKLEVSPSVNASKNYYSQSINLSIQKSVGKYESYWENFEWLYLRWKSQRCNTIEKLQELVNKVHTDQQMFNKSNVFLKQLNVGSRELKSYNASSSIDFWSSLAAFATDAASGLTSAVQACNIDEYTTTFKEIMKKDAEITKPLYAARSQCLEEYRNVEEMIRQCHSKTFEGTVCNASNTLKLEDLVSDIRNIKGESWAVQILNSVEVFLEKNSDIRKFCEVYKSVHDYLDSNPAALEACKSTGKALYGAYDTWGRDNNEKRSRAQVNLSLVSNQMLLREQRRELRELRSVADDDEASQAKLEDEINETIRILESELREIDELFEKRKHRNDSRP